MSQANATPSSSAWAWRQSAAGRQQVAQGPAATVGQDVDLGGQPATRPAEILLAAAGSSAGEALPLGYGRVHHHGLKLIFWDAALEQRVPDALLRPAPEAALERVGLAEPLWQVLPRHAGAEDLDHGLDELAQAFDVPLPDAGDRDQPG